MCIHVNVCVRYCVSQQKEISLMISCNHPNVTRYYTSFVVQHELWIVVQLMSQGEVRKREGGEEERERESGEEEGGREGGEEEGGREGGEEEERERG